MQLLRNIPRFRKAARALAALEAREHWSRQAVETYQLERINAVWSHAATHTRHYRELRRTLDLPRRFSSLAEFTRAMPTLEKNEVRRDEAAFLSSRRGSGGWRTTSGSTGEPMRFYWPRRSHQEVLRARYRFYSQWGVGIFDRTAFFWGAEQRGGLRGTAARIRQRVEDRFRNRLRLPAYRLDGPSLREAALKIDAFDPVMLYGLSKAVMHLATSIDQLGLSPKSLRAVVLTGEPASPSLQQTVERSLHAPVVIEYGATECGLIAGQTPEGELRIREDLVFVETVPSSPGRFDVLLTVLVNPAFPLLRYRIGDTTEAPIVRHEVGFAALPPIAGRTSDALVASDGAVFHSAKVDSLFESGRLARVVRRYRLDQEPHGAVKLFIEPFEEHRRADAQSARAAVQRLVGDFPVTVETVDRVRSGPAGKHRPVTSRCRAWLGEEPNSGDPRSMADP